MRLDKLKFVIYFLISAATFLNIFSAFAQTLIEIVPSKPCTTKMREKDKLEINEIIITDKELLKQIGILIEEKQKDSVFRRRGYISVLYANLSYNEEHVIRSYIIKPEYKSVDNLEIEYNFPLFYSFVNNKLVTLVNRPIFDSICYQIKTKSKKAFQKIVEPYLEKAIWIKMPNSNGKGTSRARFRPNDLLQIHGSKTLYILADGRAIIENTM